MQFRISYFILCSFLVLSIPFANAQTISGNGNIIKKERDVPPFTSINVRNGWDVILTQGEKHSMLIEADENIIPELVTEVENGVLNIYSKSSTRNTKRQRIHLTVKSLTKIKASGGADVSARTTIKADKFAVNLSGGSDLEQFTLNAHSFTGRFSGGSDATITFTSIQDISINAVGGSDVDLKGITGENCQINMKGGSDISLDGTINKLVVTAAGASDIDAYDLIVKDAILDLSGSSDVDIRVERTLDLNLNGGSDLSVKGHPKISNKRVCKSCDFSMN